MAVYDLEEQEQLDELKTWWKQYGNLVTTVITVVAVAAVAWQGWNWWRRDQMAQAGDVYAAVERAAAANDVKRARDAAGELIDKFSGTNYAALAALLSAKLQFESGDLKNAKLQLAWAADHGNDAELRDLARLRLAAVLLDEKAYDEALAQLAAAPVEPLAARYAEVRGDVLAAQGKSLEARAAYAAALAKLDEPGSKADQRHAAYRDLLQVKLESQGAKP